MLESVFVKEKEPGRNLILPSFGLKLDTMVLSFSMAHNASSDICMHIIIWFSLSRFCCGLFCRNYGRTGVMWVFFLNI